MMSLTCANCGANETPGGLFCRSCGAELQRAPTVPETRRETVTALAAPVASDPRTEIARAVAYKIAQLNNNPKDLKKLAEDILPELEKFLESPAEKRLRRMREGVVMTAIGLGGMLFFLLLGVFADEKVTPVAAVGLTLLLIGLGFIANGKWFTVNKLETPAEHQMPDAVHDFLARPAYETAPPAYQLSVTEHTTHRLAAQSTPQSKAQTNHL